MRSVVPMPIFLALAFESSVAPSASFAVCPTNFAEGGGRVEPRRVESSAPIWSGSVICGTFSLDLIAGMAQLSGGGGGGEYSCYSTLAASDTYELVGPASPIPIPFEVHVHLAGDLTGSMRSYFPIGLVCDGATVNFRISSGPAADSYTDQSISPCAGKSFDSGVVLSLAKLPDESFPIALRLDGTWWGGTGSIRGDLTFTGLPEGYTIRSCQGYGGQPVATLPLSWGNLKHIYR